MSLLARRALFAASDFTPATTDQPAYAFDPTSISGLTVWFDADAITGLSDLDLVSTWPDQSSNGHDATSSGSARPVYREAFWAGRDVVEFDGTNYLTTGTISTEAQPNTIVAVVLFGGSRPYAYDGLDGATPRHALGHNITSSSAGELQMWAGSAVGISTGVPTYRAVWTAIYDGASSELRRDAGQATANGDAGAAGFGGLTLGAFNNVGGGSKLEGQIAELLVYNRTLTSDELDDLEAYVSSKWLTLAGRTLLTTPTYDGSGQTVHPDVVKFAGGWNGWTYWMAHTPYPNADDQKENPSILVSDDGMSWEEPSGISNPLVASPTGSGYNSDCDLVYDDTNDRLALFFRERDDGDTGDENIKVMFSSDGVTWGSPTTVVNIAGGTNEVLSPAVVKDGSTWRMWTVDASQSPNVVQMRTASTADGTWSSTTDCTMNPPESGRDVWHLDVVLDGSVFRALLNTTDSGTATAGRLALASSDNATEWNISRDIMYGTYGTQWDGDYLYRGTILDDGDRWSMWFTGVSAANEWRVGHTEFSSDIFPPDTYVAPEPTSPDELSGLALWFDADAITGLSDTDSVATWPDESGNGRDATQATSSKQPTYRTGIQNGKPAVRFDDTADQTLITSSFTAESQPNTVFVVGNYFSGGDTRAYFIDGISSSNRQAFGRGLGSDDGTFGLYAGSGNSSSTWPSGASVSLPTGMDYWTLVFNGSGSSMRRNGSLYTDSGDPGTHSLTGLTIGSRQADAGNHLPGDICEIVVYNRALTTSERDEIEAYLKDKWGL